MAPVETSAGERLVGRIPVRNLWLLMLYASDLTRFRDRFNSLVEEDADDLPDLVANLLTQAVERRLKRNLTRGYRDRALVLSRVRGSIDLLKTEAHQLLARGEVACRFQDLTVDTPRNRLVRGALDLMARLTGHEDVARRCRSLALTLGRAGVGGQRPSRADLAVDQIGRNDDADRFMIALAELAFELALPTEESGQTTLVAPEREERWVRRLFEKAVLGFARFELESIGWCVRGGTHLHWQVSAASSEMSTILPRMVTDIILDPPDGSRRLIVDTKFSSILGSRRFGGATLKSGYLYQMYAYIRSQVGLDPKSAKVSGLLLHPAIEASLYEYAIIQGQPLVFATVDLAGSVSAIRTELRTVIEKSIKIDEP